MALTSIDPDLPSVFIGHGTLTDEERQALSSLVDRLKGEGYQVLLDIDRSEERVGEEFRATLHQWLAFCEACILLFTQDGIVSSNWLPIESGILENRIRTQSDFLLVPVFSTNAEPDQLAKAERWSPLRLGDLESLSYDDPHLLPKLIQLLSILKFRRRAYTEQFGKLVDFLVAILFDIPLVVAQPILRNSEQRLVGLPRANLPLLVTVSLLRTRDLDSLRQSVRTLAPFKVKAAEATLEICLPFVWLDDEIASALTSARSAPPTQRAAAARTKNSDTCEMLVLRACAEQPPWPTCVISTYEGDDPPQDLLRAAQRAMADMYWSLGADVPLDELQLEVSENPCVLVIPPPLPDIAVLAPLQETFPDVTLLFAEATQEDVIRMEYDNFVVYLATLPPKLIEDRVLRERRRLRKELDRIRALDVR